MSQTVQISNLNRKMLFYLNISFYSSIINIQNYSADMFRLFHIKPSLGLAHKNKRRNFFVTHSSSVSTTDLSWVSACSTVVEHSLQEGFTECRCQRHVKPPTWRRTRDLERSNFCHKRPPASEATLVNPTAEGGTMGEKWPRILPKMATSASLLGSFTCRKAWHGTDGFTSPPKEGVLRIFSPEKFDGFGRVWTHELGYQRPARCL
jgi:hypothetical protein